MCSQTTRTFLIIILCVMVGEIMGQAKHDYNWILGYDTSRIVHGGNAILIDFNTEEPEIIGVSTVDNFWMEGSNTSFSIEEGILKLYSNGCYIVGSDNHIIDNGDTINPGLMQEYWCPNGGSIIPQGTIAIPFPGQVSLAYVFNLDLVLSYFLVDTFTAVAPEKLLYNVIDLEANSGLGRVIEKNQVAVHDTLARGTLQAVRHNNGEDWWVIVPKSHTNCYFLVLITKNGVQPAIRKCTGHIWNDSDGGQCVFAPDGETYARFNFQNGLDIFDFDNNSGDLTERAHIDFPNDNFPLTAGVAISQNSQFLYASAGDRVYQYDLTVADIESSQTTVALVDSASEQNGARFNMAALAPNGKIYISGSSSHKYLHVVDAPDCPGLKSKVRINGLSLPSFNYISVPNFPHYRNVTLNVDCDTISSVSTPKQLVQSCRVYPNPTNGDFIRIDIPFQGATVWLKIIDSMGRVHMKYELESGNTNEVDISLLETGIYVVNIQCSVSYKSEILFKTN